MSVVGDYKPQRYFRPRYLRPITGHPIVRELFHIAAEEQMSIREVCRRAGLDEDGVALWKKRPDSCKRRRTPMLESVEAFLKPMGYKLAIVPEDFHGIRMSANRTAGTEAAEILWP